MKLATTLGTVAVALVLNACASGERIGGPATQRRLPATLPRAATAPSPRDAYLEELGNRDRRLLEEWDRAGRRALRSGLSIQPSFRERVRFPGGGAHAIAYRFGMREGQLLRVRVDPLAAAPAVYIELFQAFGGEVFRPVEAAAAGARELHLRARSTGEFVLRLQPQAGGGLYDVLVEGEASSLVFPVAGAGLYRVIGGFGDPRDGGVRRHEGIDIAAPRGTHVVAVADGRVLQARTTPVGGRIIWLSDDASDLTYYYAHLDEHFVREGERVRAGDPLGSVGTSGNAQGSPPHLHFGVYRPGTVALDPAPLLHDMAMPVAVEVDVDLLGRRGRVTADGVRLRSSPHFGGAVIRELRAATPLLVLGGIGEWHRVVLEDGTTGFIAGWLMAADDLGGDFPR
jgi:peptidoglycan LD-endopeptidase LytH